MKASEIIKEAGDWRTDPAARKAKEREQALGADPASEILTPGVSTAQDIGDISKGDYSAVPYAALGMLPGGGAASKLLKKVFRRGEKAAAKGADAGEKVAARVEPVLDKTPLKRGGAQSDIREPFTPRDRPSVPTAPTSTASSKSKYKTDSDLPIIGKDTAPTKSAATISPVDQAKIDYYKAKTARLEKGADDVADAATNISAKPPSKLGKLAKGATLAGATVYGIDAATDALSPSPQKQSKDDETKADQAAAQSAEKAQAERQATADLFAPSDSVPSNNNNGPQQGAKPVDPDIDVNAILRDPNAAISAEADRLFGPAAVKEDSNKKLDPAVLAAIQRGVYGNESGYGRAKTDKPNYAGARGPMQIIPSTFDWMKKSGIIPKEYDIKDPDQNRAAGNALIAHYYNKYEGDPAKVFAAYYAGPGSINKDGTINTHWRDRKNPKAPDVGGYIDQGLAKAGLSNITYASSKPGTNTQIATVLPTQTSGGSKPTPIDNELANLFGKSTSTIDVKDLTKDQTGLAAVTPTPLSPEEKIELAKQEASRLAAVAQAKDEFNNQYASKNADTVTEGKITQVVESINTNADLIDILRLAGRKI